MQEIMPECLVYCTCLICIPVHPKQTQANAYTGIPGDMLVHMLTQKGL